MSEMVHRGAEPVQLGGVELAEPDCVAEDFDGEVVVLNSATGVYFSLTGLAAGVWRDLMAGQSLDALLGAIGSIDTQVHQTTMDFIHRLQEAGLVRPCSATPQSASSAESIALVRAGEKTLSVQSFDDMKDLILTDPIHDVDDEAGWPIRRRRAET